jgi:hypothetical protein
VGEKKKWDLTSIHSLASAADWIRKQSDGLVVLVIRPEDFAFSVDPAVSPGDAIALVKEELGDVLAELMARRRQESEAAGKGPVLCGWPRSGEATR